MPYGVNSNFRYAGDDTLILTKAEGCYIWDADENRYIDYRCAWGPIILGHCYPAVVESVTKTIQDVSLGAMTTPLEIQVAERVARMTGFDKVRLGNTGTEVTMHALRIARAYTGREKFIKFEGQYHGMHDYVLFSTAGAPSWLLGSRRDPIAVQMSSGIPEGIRQYVISVPYNDEEQLEEAVEANWQQTAAIMLEPMLGNTAGIMPRPNYVEKIRELCDKYGIVLIFDEVKTGFRIANGGAQEYFKVKADLATYAKAMANGFPLGAIAGREEVMSVIGPGSVSQGGTYSGNVAGVAAANATLEILEKEPIIESIFKNGQRLMDGIDQILTQAGIAHHMIGLPPMFSYILGVDEEPLDARDYEQGDDELFEAISLALYDLGAMPETDGREPWFLCYSHDEKVIDETLQMFEDAVKEAKK